jgi:pimeloyl-ACP methyl ester carboxylesterase
MTATATRPSELITSGGVDIELERRGQGAPLLLLPSEDAVEADCAFVTELAKHHDVLILWPPGFGRSARPDWVTCMDDVAYIYLDILDRLDLRAIPVVGCGLGGWIAAEMATKDDARLSKLVLIDPVGIKVGGPTDRDIQDIWGLHPEKLAALKWFDPKHAERDFSGMSDDELTIVARNSESLARLCWQPYMHNPKLKHRLHRIAVPTLLIWGENDGIVTTAYGEAYRKLIPQARMSVVPQAGHLPHIEQPAAVADRVRAFIQ